MKGVLQFINAVLNFFFGLAADLLRWGRLQPARFSAWFKEPGSKLKFACGALAIGLGVLSIFTVMQTRQVIVVTRQYTQCQADAKAAADQATMDAATLRQNYDAMVQALDTVKQNFDTETDKLRLLQARNAELSAKTAAEKAKADASARSYKQQYDQRPAECTAALAAMAAACPALEGY